MRSTKARSKYNDRIDAILPVAGTPQRDFDGSGRWRSFAIHRSWRLRRFRLGRVMVRLALPEQLLERAWTGVRLVGVGPDKRKGALVTRGFAIRHRLRRVLR